MRLILVGETNPGSRTPQRLQALQELEHDVTMVTTTPPEWSYESQPSLLYRAAYHLRLPLDPANANMALLQAAEGNPDMIIFDNSRMIRPRTLFQLKKNSPRTKLVWFSEDDTMNPIHRSRWMERGITFFDLWITTKSFNAQPDEVPALGARRVLFVNNSFCRHLHSPIPINDDERRIWGAEISFVGTYEQPRAADIIALAQAGLEVRVWGNGWDSLANRHPKLRIEGRPAYGDDYRRVVAASKLNLCFLRKGNRDRQTCRSLELPAMGCAMLHEASDEVSRLFTPDHEAVYFADTSQLLTVAQRWLADDERRCNLAQAARRRAVTDGHDHVGRWRFILAQAMENKCVS